MKMVIDRAIVEQALEALEESLYATTDKSQFLAFEAITVLRAALVEPDIDPVDEYRKGFIDGQIDMRDRPEEQPEPVQKPQPVQYKNSRHKALARL